MMHIASVSLEPNHSDSRVRVAEIPTEIAQQIFAFFSTTFSVCKPASFPWFLGHVCSGWRSAFLYMPTDFWSKISITYPDKSHGRYGRYESLVRFFLRRNSTAPFSFDFTLPNTISDYPPRAADDIHRILEMLIDESMRWNSVLFDVHAPSDLLPLTRAKSLPLLWTLNLDVRGFQSERSHDISQTSPTLNVVHMYDIPSWRFKWSNSMVVILDQFALGIANFAFPLLQMMKLEQLTILCSCNPTVLLDAIVLPKLTSLYCDPTWLLYLNTPALEELSFDDFDIDYSDIVVSFIHRSSCNILRLCIKSASAFTAIRIIRHTPNLVHLGLYDVIHTEPALQQLTVSTELGHEQLVHRMESLDIIDSISSDDVTPLLDLISSRTGATAGNAGCTKLQRLKLCERLLSNVSPDIVKTMAALCRGREVQCVVLERWIEAIEMESKAARLVGT